MVSSREAPLLERALGVLEFILQHRQERTAELCLKLGPALLQALQQISVESMSQGQGSNAQGTEWIQWFPTFHRPHTSKQFFH